MTTHTNPKRERGTSDPSSTSGRTASPPTISDAIASARSKIERLLAAGFALSRNDRKIILYGQLLTTLVAASDAASFATIVDAELSSDTLAPVTVRNRPQQQELFERV